MPRPRKTVAAGYDQEHRRLRAQWSKVVETGGAVCCRCKELIRPGQPWTLDHADHLPGRIAHEQHIYAGVSHRRCNVIARNQKVARQAERPPAPALSFFDTPTKAPR